MVYQIYPRSFADGNGDGTGDIAGIRSKLGYLRDLGVDAIWINPWYLSPLDDGGYDVADYRQIEPRYGTTDEAEALITEAHEHGIKVIADVVPNHTSYQHTWFQEALQAPLGDPARDRYHFRPGKGENGSEPPSDWTSVFGGPAWSRVDTMTDVEAAADGVAEWYLHLFAPQQPDLNWENPEVVEEFEAVLRFWLDRGIDGFRVDVAHGLVKDMDYPDLGLATDALLTSASFDGHPFWDRDDIHPIVRRWRNLLDEYDGERMMVAEAWVRPERLPLYLRPDEYHQSFNFDFLEAAWKADDFRTIMEKATTAAAEVGSTPTWVLSNHDVMREATRYGLPDGTDWRSWPATGPANLLDAELGLRRARAAALLLLGLPGSAYLYQGEELGLPEVWDLPVEVLDDPVWEQSGHTLKGRDGCRVPLPWSRSGASYGFGENEGWLPQPQVFGELSASSQTGIGQSTLELFRKALHLRREFGTSDETVELLDAGDDVLAYRRGSGLICVVNFGDEAVELPDHTRVLVHSQSDALAEAPISSSLPPNTAVWLQ